MTGERASPIAEPDRRYWRRRVNRAVRKARRTRTLLRWAVAVALNVAAAAVLAYAGFQAFLVATTAPEFALETIDIVGTRHGSPDAVRARLASLRGRNLLVIDLDEVARAAASEPWVLRASVKRILPRTLRVRVTERTPAALALIHGLVHVVDEEGFVMGPAGPEFPVEGPVLTGLERLDGEPLATALGRGVRAISDLGSANGAFLAGVSEIDLSRPDRVGIVTREPGPVILLDPERVDRNLNEYLGLQAEIDSRIGPATRVDLRWADRIAIAPATSGTESEIN